MKKRFFSLLLCAALLLSIACPAHTAWATSSSDDGGIYTDPETGVTFVVPDGWAADTFNLEDAANFYQIKYSSQRDSGSSFLYGSYDLWNTMSESRRSGHTRSEVDSAYIYEEWSTIESLVNLAPEQGITIDPADIHLVTFGENEFIEIPTIQEMAGIRIESSLFWHIENGYVYIFSFLGTSDQATQDFHAVLSSLQGSPAEGSGLSDGGSRLTGGNTYTDPDTGATFVVPEGWIEQELDEDTPVVFQVKFASQEHPGSNFLYGSADLWNTMTASERSGHIRSDIDSAYIYAYEDGALVDYMAKTMIQSVEDTGGDILLDDIALVTYGSNELIEFSASQDIFGNRFPVTAILHVENGYMYEFIFASNSDQATQDFQSMVYSFQVPAAEAPGSSRTGSGQSDEMVEMVERHLVNFFLFLIELGITFFLYALPFVIYRNAIRKRPIGKKVLLIIIIVLYEFVVWTLLNAAMSWFLRRYANLFIPFIWGWFSYRKMVRSKDTDAVPQGESSSAAPQQPVRAAPPPAPAAHAPQTSPAVLVSPAPAAPVSQAPSSPKAHTPVSPTQQTPPAAPRIQFCRKCGFRLLDGSKFCSACGTPIVSITKE